MDGFYTTDDKPNGTVWDFYSDVPDGSLNGNPPYVFTFGTNQCATTPGYEGACYNREHSFPKSWMGLLKVIRCTRICFTFARRIVM